MKSRWRSMAGVTLLCVTAPWQSTTAAPASPVELTPSQAASASQSKAKKPKAPRRKKAPPVPSKPPADIPEVKEASSVWRGCLESRDVPVLASSLGVEESRLKPLLGELNLLAEVGAGCVQYVAATGGEGGAASAIFQRPDPRPGESPVLDIRKTADGITVTPGACDCPEPAPRVLEVPLPMAEDRRSELLASVPANVRWQLETLMPQMICSLAQSRENTAGSRANDTSGAEGIAVGTQSATDAGGGPYTIRIVLERGGEGQSEHLQSVEILETATGKRIDGAWWLDRPGGPGVFVGMNGVTYERLLWQSPVKYVQKTRGVGPQVITYRRRVPVPKGKNGQTTNGLVANSLVANGQVANGQAANSQVANSQVKMRTVTVRGFHLGADLMAPKGTEVHAVGEAKVAFAGRMGGFGKLIILDHGLGYQTYYAHLSVIKPMIKVGASVARGDVIGLVGSTGHSTAPHLHFETRKDAKYIDPFDNTRQLGFWLLTPDDQERLAMEMLGPPQAGTQDRSNHSPQKTFGGNR